MRLVLPEVVTVPFVAELFVDLDRIAESRHRWKRVNRDGFAGVFFARYRHHLIFFRDLDGRLGVLTVLHESMDIPARLREDTSEDEISST